MKLLVLTGSINGQEAASTKAAHLYADEFKKKYDAEIETIDLNKTEFGNTMLTSETKGKWFDNSVKWINKLKEADQVVFSTSMTNFGYTAVVKNFVDKICLANESFKYKYDGSGKSEGLIETKIQIITAQGAPKGWYPFGDHTIQLEGTFNFLGMSVSKPIVIEGTKTKEKSKMNIDDLVNEVASEIKESI